MPSLAPGVATKTISNAPTKKSRFKISNHSGARLVVASITATTVVFSNADQITGKALYAASTPGLLLVARGRDGTLIGADAGLAANITTFSSNTATVDVNFVTGGSAPALAAGDMCIVYPPIAFAPKLQGSHTFNCKAQNLLDKGYADTFDTHNTPGAIDPGGDFTAYMVSSTSGIVRMLMPLLGAYKQATTTHTLVPIESNDGTYADSSELAAFVSDANGVSDEIYFAQFVQSGTLNFPEAGIPTIQLSSIGPGAAREMGGTGKNFPSGASNFDRTAVPADQDPLFTFTDCYLELGGAFGAAMTSAVDQAVTSASFTITRGSAAPRPLGALGYTAKPVEMEYTLTATLTRIYEDDTFREKYFGTGAMPARKIETRVLFQAFDPGDSTKSVKIDIPRAIVEMSEPQRNPQGLMMEQITLRGLHTLTAAKNIDTANPLLQVVVAGNVSANLLTTLS